MPSEPAIPPGPEPEIPAEPEAPAAQERRAPEPSVQPAARAAEVERALTSRWLVWLGGLAVALSAVFLLSYAVEQGWLGPVPQVGICLALGLMLVAGGEWAHRCRTEQQASEKTLAAPRRFLGR